MPLVHFKTLLDCASRLENQELLVQLNMMDYPNLKADARKKLYKAIKKRAYPDEVEETTSVEKFQEMLKQGKF